MCMRARSIMPIMASLLCVLIAAKFIERSLALH